MDSRYLIPDMGVEIILSICIDSGVRYISSGLAVVMILVSAAHRPHQDRDLEECNFNSASYMQRCLGNLDIFCFCYLSRTQLPVSITQNACYVAERSCPRHLLRVCVRLKCAEEACSVFSFSNMLCCKLMIILHNAGDDILCKSVMITCLLFIIMSSFPRMSKPTFRGEEVEFRHANDSVLSYSVQPWGVCLNIFINDVGNMVKSQCLTD